jgi:hypothetical protein
MYRPVPRALMMVFPTRAVPLKTPETVIDGWASLRGGIESKDLAPLAILSPEPSALLPDLPVAAAIVPGFTSIGWQALAVRSGTPESIVPCPRRQPAQGSRRSAAENEEKFWLPLAKKDADLNRSTNAGRTPFTDGRRRM